MSACWVSRPTLVPFISDTLPSSGFISPEMILSSVDLPLPLTPTRPIRCPCLSVRVTSDSTRFITKLFPIPCRDSSTMRIHSQIAIIAETDTLRKEKAAIRGFARMRGVV